MSSINTMSAGLALGGRPPRRPRGRRRPPTARLTLDRGPGPVPGRDRPGRRRPSAPVPPGPTHACAVDPLKERTPHGRTLRTYGLWPVDPLRDAGPHRWTRADPARDRKRFGDGCTQAGHDRRRSGGPGAPDGGVFVRWIGDYGDDLRRHADHGGVQDGRHRHGLGDEPGPGVPGLGDAGIVRHHSERWHPHLVHARHDRLRLGGHELQLGPDGCGLDRGQHGAAVATGSTGAAAAP